MSELDLLKRKLARERAARKEAELLLEQKSRLVYETNEELRDLADQNKAIVESAADGIMTYQSDGTIRSFNRSAERIFGVDSAIGSNVRALFEQSKKLETTLFPPKGSFSNGNETPEANEVKGIHQNGNVFQAEVTVSQNTHRGVVGFTVVVRDLSSRKKLEAQLMQSQKMESVGQLAAGIAHEINTPIQFIGNNILFLQGAFDDIGELLDLFEKLVAAVKTDAPTKEVLDRIEQQMELADLPFLREEFPGAIEQTTEGIERVATIVRAMKEFSQPSSQRKSKVDINRAIENALAVSANRYRDIAEVELCLQSEFSEIDCIGGQMNQVILNLLSNAAEAVAEHCTPGPGQISVTTRTTGNCLEIRVADNGPGIPPDIRDRIFDPFFTTKEVGKGTGQGLAFVYDVIVNKHDGSVHVLSPECGGTILVVSIPHAKSNLLIGQENARTTV